MTRLMALQAVAEAASAVCHLRTCPCCEEEWICHEECTFAEDCPASAEELADQRRLFLPLRNALVILEEGTTD